jgi:hypothetical protein
MYYRPLRWQTLMPKCQLNVPSPFLTLSIGTYMFGCLKFVTLCGKRTCQMPCEQSELPRYAGPIHAARHSDKRIIRVLGNGAVIIELLCMFGVLSAPAAPCVSHRGEGMTHGECCTHADEL